MGKAEVVDRYNGIFSSVAQLCPALCDNGILLSHKKGWNNAICSNRDAPRDYHTNWSKSEKDKYYVISFICGTLKKKIKWTYLQNRNRLTDLENQLIGSNWLPWGKGWGEGWIAMYTLLYIKQITNKDLLCRIGNSAQHSVKTKMRTEFAKEQIHGNVKKM